MHRPHNTKRCGIIYPNSFLQHVQVNPEAPSGSFRQKDLEREARNAGKEATVGLDGKVYSFIDAPSDESSAEEAAKKSALSERHFLVVWLGVVFCCYWGFVIIHQMSQSGT